MFVPRAVSLRLGRSDGPAMKMAKADDQVAALLVAYLRKRKLSKTLKSFLAETSFKDSGVAVEDDLETICTQYFMKSAIPEKSKTQSGVLGTVAKKARISELEDKGAGNLVGKTPTVTPAIVSAKKGDVSVSNAEPARQGSIAAHDTSSSSDDSDTGGGKGHSLKANGGQEQRSVAASLQKPAARNARELAPSGGKPECETSSSDDSDSSSAEETQPVKMVEKPVIKKPGAPPSSGKTPGESSSSDDSDSSDVEETQPVKVVQKSVTTEARVFPSGAKTQGESSSSDDSDSSSEEETKPVKVVQKSVTKEVRVIPSGAKTQGESSSSDDSDQSTEEETKPVKVVQGPVVKKAGVGPSGDEAHLHSPSDDSDSSSEEDTEAPLKVVQQPVKKKTQKASNGAKFQRETSSSADSDSSSEENTMPAKVVQGPIMKKAGVAPSGDVARLNSSSDDSDSSSEEDTEPLKVVQQPVTRKTQMASSGSKFQQKSASSDDSDSSSEEDAEPVKQVHVPVKKKVEQNKSVQTAESSSDDSESSSDEEPKVASSSQTTAAIPTASAKQSVNTDKRMNKAKVDEAKARVTEKGVKSTPASNIKSVHVLETRERSIGDGLTPGKTSEASAENGSDQQNALNTDSTDNKSKKRKSSQGLEKEGGTKFFQKIDITEVTYADPKLQDNSYWAKNGADEGWGAKAQMTLQNVKGKGFRHEKTKKKRGSYKGGVIDFASHSIKFQDSDEE